MRLIIPINRFFVELCLEMSHLRFTMTHFRVIIIMCSTAVHKIYLFKEEKEHENI